MEFSLVQVVFTHPRLRQKQRRLAGWLASRQLHLTTLYYSAIARDILGGTSQGDAA